jgi:putative transposase
MRKSRFTEERIIGMLKEYQAGVPVADICRKRGISNKTFYTWNARFGGMDVSDAKKPRALESDCGSWPSAGDALAIDSCTLFYDGRI